MAEIEIYGDIGGSIWGDGVTDTDVRKMLLDHGPGDLTVRINSGGGEVFQGVAIANQIRNHDGPVTVIVDGVAASIASVIAVAGDVVTIGAGAFFMIHNPWTMTAGGSGELRKTADLLDKIRDEIVDLYSLRISDRDQLTRWMDEETWFTGQEAVDAGFADVADLALRAEPAASAQLFADNPGIAASAHSPQTELWRVEARRRQLQLSAKRAGV